ncbi:MAG TPA: argininosuccinate lyase, partial [Geminicoccaceae bacterium]|nr:argininosuccinate lyase [Geminicoccaceae bacterium]
MKRDVFLEEARLGPRSESLIAYEEVPHLARLRRRLREYALVDLAHAVMLTETGILSPERGARLLGGLLRILEHGAEGFPWVPTSGSYLVHAEHRLGELVGEDVAGRLQTGRSRNDQSAAAERLYLRDLLVEVAGDLIALQSAVLDRAERHALTLMPGYTHLQHAQPATFGHSLMRHASALDRDLARVADAFPRMNLSALGGAAMAGTSWPVDRRRVAALLGHEGLVVNSSDAGAFARDALEEAVAVLTLLMSDLGRFATDLYVWHSFEFGFLEIADGLAGTSSIMPQKKNPHALERVKAQAGQAVGWLPAMLGSQRGVLSTDLDHAFGDDALTPMGDACLGSLRLMTETVRTLIVHEDAMAAKAGAFWSTTSHLADELVRRYDLPFRAAHHVVGRLVRDSLAAGLGPGEVEAAALARAGREMAGVEIGLSDRELREALDARRFLDTRASEGSVKPEHVRAHRKALAEALEGHAAWHAGKSRLVSGAVDGLLERARALAAGGGWRRRANRADRRRGGTHGGQAAPARRHRRPRGDRVPRRDGPLQELQRHAGRGRAGAVHGGADARARAPGGPPARRGGPAQRHRHAPRRGRRRPEPAVQRPPGHQPGQRQMDGGPVGRRPRRPVHLRHRRLQHEGGRRRRVHGAEDAPRRRRAPAGRRGARISGGRASGWNRDGRGDRRRRARRLLHQHGTHRPVRPDPARGLARRGHRAARRHPPRLQAGGGGRRHRRRLRPRA